LGQNKGYEKKRAKKESTIAPLSTSFQGVDNPQALSVGLGKEQSNRSPMDLLGGGTGRRTNY